MRGVRLLIVALLALLTIGCVAEEAAPATKKITATPSALHELPSPAAAGSAEPFLFTTRNGVGLSWLEPVPNSDRVALRFAILRGGQWSAPRTIAERNDLFVNWADFPSVLEDAKGTLFAHWLQKSGAGTYSYDIRMATSTDGGVTWSAPFLLNRDGKEREHGFASLAALPNGGVGATWLDGRNMSAGGEHEGHDGGEMTVRYAAVDAKGTLTGDVEVDGRACECCTTGMAMTSSGPVIVYRDRSADEIRDISFVKREGNGWTKPKPLHADGWKIAGCPVNGPQIDAIGERVAAAWFTAAADKGRAFVAFSDDAGATFAKPVAIDEGKPIGRLDVVLLDRDTALVSWLEQTATGGELRARRVRRDGTAEPSIKIADSSTARAAGFARIARSEKDVYFAWTEHTPTSKRIHVARKGF